MHHPLLPVPAILSLGVYDWAKKGIGVHVYIDFIFLSCFFLPSIGRPLLEHMINLYVKEFWPCLVSKIFAKYE